MSIKNYIEEKNIPGLIIFTLVIAVGLVAGISAWNSYQANIKITQLNDFVFGNIEQKNPQTQNVKDEFSLLSSDAKKYYDELGRDKITGTPMFLINGKEYKGFDYRNNIIPGFDISEGFKDVIIFSSPTCGFCQKAEMFFDNNDIDYTMVCAPIHPGDYELCKKDESYII